MPSRRLGSPFARVLGVAVSVLLAVSMAPSYADDGPAPRPVDGDGVDSTAEAIDALETAEQVLSGKGPQDVDATLALIKAKQLASQLPILDRNRAEKLLARPTDGSSRGGDLINYPSNAEVQRNCGENVCIHWVANGRHAPSSTDTNDNDVPDWVETTRRVVENSWQREVTELGFRGPRPDGRRGGNSKLDVYLGDLGAEGVFGYANTDANSAKAAPGYLVLDNDYRDYQGGTPLGMLRATVAHEFFHLVQFAYSTNEDTWFMEATASWMEEQVYDATNDNRRYLPYSTLGRPARSLDSDTAKYGNWVFFQHLSEAYGPKLIRTMWERSPGRTYSIQAIQAGLKSRGTTLQKRFSRFAVNNLMPGRTYSEGAAYKRAKVNRTWALGPDRPATAVRSTKVNHLSSRNFTFRPRAGLGPKWKLRLSVKGRTRLARPVALVQFRDGKVRRREIKLGERGQKTIRIDFSAAKVRRVTLNLSNVSLRYRCNTGGFFACNGNSRDDRAPFTFRAVAFRS